MLNKKIISLLGNSTKHIFYIVLLMVISLISSIIFTGGFSYIIYYLYTNTIINFYNIGITIIIMLLSILSRFLSTIQIGIYKNDIGTTIKKDLREKVYNKITKTGLSILDTHSISTITQSTMEGIEQLDLYFTVFLPQFFYSLIAPIILFLVSVFLNYKVSLVLIATVPLIPISIMLFTRRARKIVKKYLDEYYKMGDTFLDSISGLNELKMYLKDDIQSGVIDEKATRFRKVTMKVLSMQLASITIMDFVAFGGAALGIILNFVNNNFSLENLIGFSTFLILIAVEFFIPVRTLGSAFHITLNGVTAAKKVISILELKTPKDGIIEYKNGIIEFENLSFSYEKKQILKNINFKITPKTLTSFVGLSGSGKSTIVKLLLKIINPTIGNIIINNVNLKDISNKSYYKNICSLSYDTFIFNDTLRNNFLLLNPNITDDEIISLLKKVKLNNLIKENNLDYIINEQSSNLSGGERQRLALAINLSINKEIYIFDEITSNIDIDSEKIIMDIIKNLALNHTVILISHRLENVIHSNTIYYLENGRITEQGKHEELLKNKLGYYNTYRNQKRLEEGYLLKGERYEN